MKELLLAKPQWQLVGLPLPLVEERWQSVESAKASE
jgi:hypothetical protein